MKTKTKIIIFLSVITIILAAIIGGRAIIAQKISVKIAESKKAPVGVIATKVKYSQFYNQIESFGTAISNQSYSIRIKKDNLVSSVNFDSYPYVKKGTVIATLVNNEKIIAPFDGRIGKREITPGILGGENSIIANLDDIKFLKLDIKLPENYLGVIKQGLKVEVSTDAFPKIFKGTIETISSRVDPTTRSILVQAKINNDGEELIPGMLLNVKVIFNEKQSLGVPEEALLIQGDDKFIYKINNNEITQAKVNIGRRNFGKVEILYGLNENDLILAEGTNKVRPKSKVKIVKTVD